MPLKYALFENHLTSDPNDYMAKVQTLGTKSLEDVIDVMINRGSTVTKADALSVLEEYSAALEQCLRDGHSVNTPLFNISPSIRGVFYGKDDPFTPSRHRLRINMTPGVRLRQLEEQIQLERVSPVHPTPDLEDFEDVTSETRNATVTPGGLARLRGSRLKYEPNDPAQGIFFIGSTGTETRVDNIVRNKPGELNFLIPDTLAAGTYTLQVRAKLEGVNDVRSGALLGTLQVL